MNSLIRLTLAVLSLSTLVSASCGLQDNRAAQSNGYTHHGAAASHQSIMFRVGLASSDIPGLETRLLSISHPESSECSQWLSAEEAKTYLHREALAAEAQRGGRLVRFVNLLTNDVTHLLDQALTHLAQIHTIQAEMAALGWGELPQAQRTAREQALHEIGRQASGYCDVGLSATAFLRTVTAGPAATDALALPELAAMLGRTLDALVGPRCADLRVEQREQYRWDPRALLREILLIYVNLAGREAFVRAVAEEGHSCPVDLFPLAANIAHRRAIGVGEQQLAELAAFVERVEAMKLTIGAQDNMDVDPAPPTM